MEDIILIKKKIIPFRWALIHNHILLSWKVWIKKFQKWKKTAHHFDIWCLVSLYLSNWASASHPCLFSAHYPSGLTCCCDATVFLKQPNPKCTFYKFPCPVLACRSVHCAMKQHVVVAKWDGFPRNPADCWGYFEILNDKRKDTQTRAKVKCCF